MFKFIKDAYSKQVIHFLRWQQEQYELRKEANEGTLYGEYCAWQVHNCDGSVDLIMEDEQLQTEEYTWLERVFIYFFGHRDLLSPWYISFDEWRTMANK